MREPLLQSVALITATLAFSIALYFIITPPAAHPYAHQGSISRVLNGAGSTLAAPQVIEWARSFKEATGIVVEYSPVGSGAGRAMFFNGTAVFAVSDPPLDKETYLEYKGRVLQFPVLAGAVVVTYNLPEIPSGTRLNLTGEVLALIYKGEVSRWCDERIKSINPAVAGLLPDKEIIVVHRSDSSGTTRVFTGYLHKVAPDIWGSKLVGFTVEWPVDATGRGLGGKGNEGVASIIKANPYSIGYVEASYALYTGMPIARLMNKAGFYTEPSKEAVLSAINSVVDQLPDTPLGDFSSVLDALLDAPGSGSYPIVTFSYMFVYRDYGDPYTARALGEFIRYILTQGQGMLLPGYYPLPGRVVEIGLKAVDALGGGG